MRESVDRRGWLSGAAFGAAILFHAAVGYLYLVSGLAAPVWAVGLLMALWGAMTVFLVQAVRRNKPSLGVSIPFAGAALWILIVPGLGTLLNWSP